MSPRQPWFKQYPSDWRGDTNLRACSLAARGLWAECLGMMHEADPRGYLIVAGLPVTVDQLALHVGRPLKEVRMALDELMRHGVPSVDDDGILYSRRMVRDTAKSEKAASDGARGGNPTLKGQVKGEVKGHVNGTLIPARAHAHLASGISGVETAEEPDLLTARFERFWEAYPRHEGRKAALKAFQRIKPDHELLPVLLDAVARQKLTRQWREGFAPHASTWLNGERWKDEAPKVAGPVAVASWRDACPHRPTCGTPRTCELLKMKADAEVPA